MATPNQQLMNEIYFNIPVLSEKITNGFNKYYYYLEYKKDEKYEEKPNETEEESIKRAESVFDRLDGMMRRNELTNKKANETIEVLNKMTKLFEQIVKTTNDEKEKLIVTNNELIDIIIDLERRKTTKLIGQNPNRQGNFRGIFEDVTNEWNEHRIKTIETLQKQTNKRVSKPLTNLDKKEMKQIEEWSGMKIGNIIFDSNVDNWDVNTSVFGERIINKRNLLFIIEDEDDNKFGGYINATIDKINDWISDPKSYVFSLKSNGRLNGMLKFDIQYSEKAFYSNDQPSYTYLFGIGGGFDIGIGKENSKNYSHCRQTASFNYNGIRNALCGIEYPKRFIPKRITVTQLI